MQPNEFSVISAPIAFLKEMAQHLRMIITDNRQQRKTFSNTDICHVGLGLEIISSSYHNNGSTISLMSLDKIEIAKS
jgi:hypothetical protein